MVGLLQPDQIIIDCGPGLETHLRLQLGTAPATSRASTVRPRHVGGGYKRYQTTGLACLYLYCIQERGGPETCRSRGSPSCLTCSTRCFSAVLAASVSFVMPGGDEADGVIASLARREDHGLHDTENYNPMTLDFFAVGRTPRHAIPVLLPPAWPPVRSPVDRHPPEPSSRRFYRVRVLCDGTVLVIDSGHYGHWSRLRHLAPRQSIS